MRGEERLPLENIVALSSACGIPAAMLANSALADAFPDAHAKINGAWSGELTKDERRLLEIYRTCGAASEINMDLETSDRVAIALIQSFGGT